LCLVSMYCILVDIHGLLGFGVVVVGVRMQI